MLSHVKSRPFSALQPPDASEEGIWALKMLPVKTNPFPAAAGRNTKVKPAPGASGEALLGAGVGSAGSSWNWNPALIPSRGWENRGLGGNEGFLQLCVSLAAMGLPLLFGSLGPLHLPSPAQQARSKLERC